MKLRVYIDGMTCVICSKTVSDAIKKIEGVKEVSVNFSSGLAIIETDNEIDRKILKQVIKKAGYKLRENDDSNEGKSRAEFIAECILAGVLLLFAMLPMAGVKYPRFISPEESPIVFASIQFLFCLPVIIMGWGYYYRGFKNLIFLKPNMDSLVAVSTASAFVYSIYSFIQIILGDNHSVHALYFESVAVIIALISLGKFLEHRSLTRTTEAISKLASLAPKTARVIRDGVELEIDSFDIVKGDIVVVKSGESFSCDGIIIDGTTDVDESMITGESLPIDKNIGDRVIAGTINGNGGVKFKAEGVGSETTLSKIIAMVEDAQGSKAPIAKLADKISRIFVPSVIAIAIIAAIIWAIVGKDSGFSLTIFVAVLTISCPCALGLATPTAIITGTGRGASRGILYKNAQALESSSKINTIVFDKTGTITQGKPKVTDSILEVENKKLLLSYVASLEAFSSHPLSVAIVEYAKENGVDIIEAKEYENISGFGIKGVCDGKIVFIGKKDLLENNSVDSSKYDEKAIELSNDGKSIVYIAIEFECVGLFGIADIIKDGATQAIQELEKRGLKTVLLTGDNKRAADFIAKQAGISQIIAEVLPDEKANVIKDLIQKGNNVAMVGDGINDSPALATANVGIAMGSGSDIAIESADVVLTNSNLTAIVDVYDLSVATMINIKQNLFWAFIYNIIGIPFAAGVFYVWLNVLLNPMIAALAMSLSSVSVVTNALRLKGFKFKTDNKNKKESFIKKKGDDDMFGNVKQEIKVEGMSCMHCEKKVCDNVKLLSGVKKVSASAANSSVELTYDPKKITIDEVKKCINELGYKA